MYKFLSSDTDKIYGLSFLIMPSLWFSEDVKLENFLKELKNYSDKCTNPVDKLYGKFYYLSVKGFFLGGVNNPEVTIDQSQNFNKQALDFGIDLIELLKDSNSYLFHWVSALFFNTKARLENDLEKQISIHYQYLGKEYLWVIN